MLNLLNRNIAGIRVFVLGYSQNTMVSRPKASATVEYLVESGDKTSLYKAK